MTAAGLLWISFLTQGKFCRGASALEEVETGTRGCRRERGGARRSHDCRCLCSQIISILTKGRTMIAKIIVAGLMAFAGILGLYAATASNPVSSRLGFATFMSVVPAICTAFLLRVTKSSTSWGVVLLVYFALFVAEQILWGWLHG